MKNDNRHNRILNRLLVLLIRPFLKVIFRFRFESQKLPGPALVICNHVTNFDPLLVSICFPKDHMHFVASEHLFRKGLLTRFLKYVFDPIPRRKGTTGADTAMACLRKLKQGRSVCLFAEGKCTWDGITAEIVPSTGRLARMSGVSLITCRLEGAYLTAPRWGKGIRPGKMGFRVVGTYSPETLRTMDGQQIEELIQRDIHENIWESQKTQPVRYRSRRRAENLQTVLYLCPRCRKAGNLTSKGKHLLCGCGAKWEYTEFGAFEPREPLENIAQWDAWQRRELARQLQEGNVELQDEQVTVYSLGDQHQETVLTTDTLILQDGVLRCGHLQWPLADIDALALVQSRNLMLSCGEGYYQLKAAKSCSLRKYRAAWKAVREQSQCEV
jgi:1-acyl-sn-glycerol-3-phosphate acyltransferase